MKHPPIAVMSFDRPGYLREVLVSLAAQKDAQIEEREIFLFQDGWRNEFSGRVAADEHDIAACVLVFRGISRGAMWSSRPPIWAWQATFFAPKRRSSGR